MSDSKKLGQSLEGMIKLSADEQDVDCTRLKDAGYMGDNSNVRRFTPTNICDFILFQSPAILYAEAKRRDRSLAFKEITQFNDLEKKWKPEKNCYSGLICCLRGCYYFASFKQLKIMRDTIGKKSFNVQDLHQYATPLRLFTPHGKRSWRLDIAKLMAELSVEATKKNELGDQSQC